jgi:hypothetical protein
MKRVGRFCLVVAAFVMSLAAAAFADEVTDWNQNLFQAALAATPPTNPLVMSRVTAIVQSAVFDAANGIARKYTPIHVEPAAPGGASQWAAVVQAAYATLVALYPDQLAALDAKRAASLAAIPDGPPKERGIQWGQTVAAGILAWRSTDGFAPPPPPFLGGLAVGQWRPTPPTFLPGAGPQFAYMTPWVIESPSQFRPSGPPALDSPAYTSDFIETKLMGSLTSGARTLDQTTAAQFWAASSASYYWNLVTVELTSRHQTSLLEEARLLALVDLAMADAAIACWEAKYTYVFWRPVTAIPLAATDPNPDTVADPAWMPLLVTPAHQEYPSGHSTVSGAAAAVLAAEFGDDTAFDVTSDVMLGVTRSFTSFTASLDEIKDARINAGIHFRSACNDGQATGIDVANYVLEHALQRAHGNGN